MLYVLLNFLFSKVFLSVGRTGGEAGQHPDLDPRPGRRSSPASRLGGVRGQAAHRDQRPPLRQELSQRRPLHHGKPIVISQNMGCQYSLDPPACKKTGLYEKKIKQQNEIDSYLTS